MSFVVKGMVARAWLLGGKKSVHKKVLSIFIASPQSCRDVDRETVAVVAVARLIAVKKETSAMKRREEGGKDVRSVRA